MRMGRSYRVGALIVASIVVLLLAAGCALGGGRQGTVQGTVTWARDAAKPLDEAGNVGKPVPGAEVVVYTLTRFEDVKQQNVFQKGAAAYKGVTDDKGAFSCALVSGDYVVEIVVNGQRLGSRKIEVKGGKTTDASVNLKPLQ